MNLFTLTALKPSEEFVKQMISSMKDELALLHMEKDVSFSYEAYDTYVILSADGNIPAYERRKKSDTLYRMVGDAVADYIIRYEESGLIKGLIKKEYDYYDDTETAKIISYCSQFLNGHEEDPVYKNMQSTAHRKQKIADEVHQFLHEYMNFHLQGFIQFRLGDYAEELHEVVEYAVDEFLMERQYQEFISLLKYFVYIQEAKTPAAHLIHKGGSEFTILNDQLQPIDANQLDSSFTIELLDKDINFEDMIVSTLITVSPEQIYIHTREPDVQIISTISQIFEHRVTICPYCRTCKIPLGDPVKQDQLSP